MASEGDLEPPEPSRTPDSSAPLVPDGIGVRHRRVRAVPAIYAEPVLPSPADLAGYRTAARQAPLAILGEFLAEGEHRRKVELEIVRDEKERAARGQHYALVIMLAGMVVSGCLILTGHDWAGTAVAGGNLVAMGTVFLRAGRNRDGDPPGATKR